MIQAMDAARFLKKSGLSDVVLSRVSEEKILLWAMPKAVLSFDCNHHIYYLCLAMRLLGLGLIRSHWKRLLGQTRLLCRSETCFIGAIR